jgi:hypothetical protein
VPRRSRGVAFRKYFGRRPKGVVDLNGVRRVYGNECVGSCEDIKLVWVGMRLKRLNEGGG